MESVTRRFVLAGIVPAAAALLPVSPGLALGIGLTTAALLGPRLSREVRRFQKPLLQGAVVLMGLGMEPGRILVAARDGLGLSLATLGFCFAFGLFVAHRMGIPRRIAALVCAGTGICGGSAIAAAGAAMEADEEEMGTALGVVFLLNAVGLYLFPVVSGRLHLAPETFGTWSGLALHDLSSVVAAAAQAGDGALATGLSTKLARTLWIVPVAFLLGIAFAPEDGGGASLEACRGSCRDSSRWPRCAWWFQASPRWRR